MLSCTRYCTSTYRYQKHLLAAGQCLESAFRGFGSRLSIECQSRKLTVRGKGQIILLTVLNIITLVPITFAPMGLGAFYIGTLQGFYILFRVADPYSLYTAGSGYSIQKCPDTELRPEFRIPQTKKKKIYFFVLLTCEKNFFFDVLSYCFSKLEGNVHTWIRILQLK